MHDALHKPFSPASSHPVSVIFAIMLSLPIDTFYHKKHILGHHMFAYIHICSMFCVQLPISLVVQIGSQIFYLNKSSHSSV